MAKTIGNPLSWTFSRLGNAAGHVSDSIGHLGGEHSAVTADEIVVNPISTTDLRWALARGWEDLGASRTDAIFIVLIYPVIGLVLSSMALNSNLLPLLFPLISGFAILGPVAAVGLYEISRRREKGLPATWGSALRVVEAPNFGAVVVLGLYLLGVFIAWLMAAYALYLMTLGPEPPVSATTFLRDVFTTGAGWTMLVVGVAVGFVFALVALAISVVSFPLILDRDVGVPVAVVTSVRVARENPRTIAAWGLIVAGGLVLGSVPFFVGLIVVMPLLGHATWHLYRRAVAI